MKSLTFTIYFCGMNSETFSENIMIYKPHDYIKVTYTEEDLDKLGLSKVSDIIAHMISSETISFSLGPWGTENFTCSTSYIKVQDYLLGLKEDKRIEEIFNYLDSNQLEFAHFIVGGASLHDETGYRFTIHSDEKIHAHLPHVHVSKGEVEIRYSLETLLPMDKLENPHRRDEKKIIKPFLEKNKERLMSMWVHNLNGYYTPTISDDGKQFYAES